MQRYDFFFNNQQFISEPPKAPPLVILVILVILGLLVILEILVLLAIPTPTKKKTKKRESQNHETPYKRLAATYFPTNRRSIIGDAGLNFSVRNGKRCDHTALPPQYISERARSVKPTQSFQ